MQINSKKTWPLVVCLPHFHKSLQIKLLLLFTSLLLTKKTCLVTDDKLPKSCRRSFSPARTSQSHLICRSLNPSELEPQVPPPLLSPPTTTQLKEKHPLLSLLRQPPPRSRRLEKLPELTALISGFIYLSLSDLFDRSLCFE